MNIGFIIPYVLLGLMMIEEYQAILLILFFIIPLMDSLFYFEIPKSQTLSDSFINRVMFILYFPSFLYVSSILDTTILEKSISSMICMGILYNTLIYCSQELQNNLTYVESVVGQVITEFIGYNIQFEIYYYIRTYFFSIYMLLC
jgi:hypothetical protein